MASRPDGRSMRSNWRSAAAGFCRFLRPKDMEMMSMEESGSGRVCASARMKLIGVGVLCGVFCGGFCEGFFARRVVFVW